MRLCAGYINSKEDIQTPCLVAFYQRGGRLQKAIDEGEREEKSFASIKARIVVVIGVQVRY